MDRADAGGFDFTQGSGSRLNAILGSVFQKRAQLVLHILRSILGEGDHEELRNRRVRLPDQRLLDFFHHDGRFTGTGSGRNQDILVLRVNGRLLRSIKTWHVFSPFMASYEEACLLLLRRHFHAVLVIQLAYLASG